MSSPEAPSPAPSPATIFGALGDPTRLAMLAQLSDGRARSIAALASGSELTRQAVTKHLRVLEGAGLVASLKVGRESRYHFRPAAVQTAASWLDQVSAQWDAALGRLKAFVEG